MNKKTIVAFLSFLSAGVALGEEAYIQSVGKTGINTGYFINAKTKVEIDFQMTTNAVSLGYQMRLWGQNGTGVGNAAVIYFGNTARDFKVGYGNTFTGVDLAPCDEVRHTIVYDGPKNVCTFATDGAVQKTVNLTAAHDATANFPMFIFGESLNADGSSFDAWAYMKLYSLKVYEDDQLVHNYIPAKKDDVLGVWDVVDEKFLCGLPHKDNLTGEIFVAGGDVYEVPGDPYIESNGTSGINTGVYCQPGLKAEVDYQFTDASVVQTRIVAIDSDDQHPRLSAYINGNGYIALTSGDTWNSPNTTDIKADLLRHTVVLDSVAKKSSFVTGGIATKTVNSVAFTKWSTRQIGLMAGVNNGAGNTFANKAKIRIYGAKFWVNGELIRSFEPRLVNDVAGFEETVKGGFYTCDGLTASAGVSSEMTGPGYVESDQSLYSTINTHYYVNPKTRIEVDYQQIINNSGKIICGAYNDNTVCTLVYVNGSGVMCPTIRDGNYSTPTMTTSRNWDLACHKAILDAKTGRQALIGQEGNVEAEGYNTPVTKSAGRPFAFFGTSTTKGGKSDQRAKARVFGAKIYEENVLIHDFKPVSQDGIPGLLDEKTGEFFTGGNITGGGKLTEVAGDAYIESPYGNRSIDTDYYVTAKTTLVCDYMPLVQQKNQQFPFEAGDVTSATNANDKMYMRMYGNGSTGEGDWAYAFGKSGWTSTSVPYAPHVRRLLTMDGKGMKVKIESAGGLDCDLTIASTAPCENKSSTTLKLFSNCNGTGNVAKGRLYGFRIYEDGELVHDYKPVKVSGLTALKDEVTGQVLGWSIAAAATPPIECGSATPEIAAEAGTLYIEGDGSRTLNTGYRAKGNSRIEIDFAYLTTDGSKVLCGVWTPSSATDALIRYAPWHETRTTKIIFAYNGATQRTPWPTTDVNRHTVVMDFKNKKLQYNTMNNTDEQTITDKVGWADDTVCNIPMGVFGTFKDAAATVSDGMRANGRIYGIKVYEDDVLVHEFVPAMNGSEATLYDLNDKVYASVVKFADGSDLKIGGKGYDGTTFVTDLPAKGVVRFAEPLTLSVAAPGAKGYQWYKDGVAIAGATESSYVVEWVCKAPESVYSCEASFDVYGKTETEMSSGCAVEMLPSGMSIIIR